MCADPDTLPYSHRNEQGFENKLAELLAAEMNALVTYDWGTYNADTINLRLRGGECDAIMGVPDDQEGLLKTVAYYRSPFVFATLKSAGLTIGSLDDPQLQTLKIGVQNYSIPPQDGLFNRGIVNVHGPSGTAPNPHDRVLRELIAGIIDVGILWGPNAEYLARELGAEFDFAPVTPEIDAPFIPMSLPMTIGVRARDYSLRDRLDLAIAARWDEIHELLVEYGVPLSPTAKPMASLANHTTESGAERSVMAGVLLPMTTGNRTNSTSLYDLVGDAAFRGVELAASDLNAAAQDDRFQLLVSSTPSAAAAKRAADRLITVEGVDALIGGLGDGQSEVLSELAANHDTLFLDVGTVLPAGPIANADTTFYLEASSRSYLDATIETYATRGVHTWFVVYEDGDRHDGEDRSGTTLLATTEQAISANEVARLVGSIAAEPAQPDYSSVAQAIRSADPDGVLVLLGATDQLAFLGQTVDLGVEAVLAPLPLPVTQTRDFIGATITRVAYDSNPLRVVSFEPERVDPVAVDDEVTVAQRFAARYATPMEASAFAGYQALLLLDSVANATDARTSWVSQLAQPGATFDGPKGTVWFDAARRLQQPLDVIEIDRTAQWHNTLAGRTGVARYLETVAPSSERGE